MLYEMVTGRLPFKADYENAVVHSILNTQQEPMTGPQTGVPMELEQIVNKALAKQPGERYRCLRLKAKNKFNTGTHAAGGSRRGKARVLQWREM